MTVWTTEEAVMLCREIENISPRYGLHVALTGGLLYKDGMRKDADILLYRIRQSSADFEGLFKVLAKRLNIVLLNDYGWCKKAIWMGKPIDFFDPEDGGAYPVEGTDDLLIHETLK